MVPCITTLRQKLKLRPQKMPQQMFFSNILLLWTIHSNIIDLLFVIEK
jgi:hypothetical protein